MAKDGYNREWITDNAVNILSRYEPGILTIRALHYQLVGLGMHNTQQHYKRVVAAMTKARWDGVVDFDAFSDRDRVMASHTKADPTSLDGITKQAKQQVGAWMNAYNRNKWENQPYYPEVFIEKKALEGVFYRPCLDHDIALGACKGYPSLTFLKESALRLQRAAARGKDPIIIYFGDYDPSGEDIPRALEENLLRMGVWGVEVRRIALMEEQVVEWKLPPAPAKLTDSRTANWDGLGQVELDAVAPEKLIELLDGAVAEIFDEKLYAQLLDEEEEEREIFKIELKRYVKEDL